MEDLKKHEIFEMEVLEKLKNKGFLAPLVFGGGTMLRLCHDMRRYSTDLDFWLVKKIDVHGYYDKVKKYLASEYKLTDSKNKYFTMLFEISSKEYPRKLKIEIRKKIKTTGYAEQIAFSEHSNKQVILRCLSLEEMMKNKIEAFLDRKEIRDCFDMEFILRQGIKLGARKSDLIKMKELIRKLGKNDYTVKLGSVLDAELRKYYIKSNFSFLLQQINAFLTN